MTANRNIKIYGTLLNATVNAIIGDADHNDALAYAYQLYDDRFGDEEAVNNFQDIINKRLTAISYADGVTTIKNRAGIADGVPYMFKVEGNSNINGNLDVAGNESVGGDLSVVGNIAGDKIIAQSGLSVRGDVDIYSGGLTVSGPTVFESTFDVYGGSTFRSLMNATGITSTADVVAPNITAIRSAIDLLNSSEETQGSIRNIAAEYIAKVIAEAPEDFNTLMELAAWILANGKDASAMNYRITKNTEDIQSLEDSKADMNRRISAIDAAANLALGAVQGLSTNLGQQLNQAIENFQTNYINPMSTRISQLESAVQALQGSQYWTLGGSNNDTVVAASGRKVQGAGFYDTTV